MKRIICGSKKGAGLLKTETTKGKRTVFLGNLSLANKRGRRREGLQFDFFLVHYYNSYNSQI